MSTALGFDSSVLSPFARATRIDALERLVHSHRCVVTRAVLDELDRGSIEFPVLASVRALPWLEVVSIDSLDELRALTDYARILGSGGRNIGEASILAWAELTSSIAVIDDNAAVIAGRRRDVKVRRTLGLLCDGLHRKLLTTEQACTLVDELVSAGGARFPCDGAGFVQWAERSGLLGTG
jgi:predicted nucleic acid-binding protein